MGARSARRADWLRARRARRVFTPHVDHLGDVPDVVPDVYAEHRRLYDEFRRAFLHDDDGCWWYDDDVP